MFPCNNKSVSNLSSHRESSNSLIGKNCEKVTSNRNFFKNLEETINSNFVNTTNNNTIDNESYLMTSSSRLNTCENGATVEANNQYSKSYLKTNRTIDLNESSSKFNTSKNKFMNNLNQFS